MYFSNGAHNQLVQFNITTGEIRPFSAGPLGNLQPFNDITTAPDGVYFSQTTANVITHFDHTTHEMTDYELPTPASDPLGMFYVSDGGIWVLELTAAKIARFDRETKSWEEYETAELPLVVRAEVDGVLYFACTSGSIGGIDLVSREVYNYPAGSLLIEVAQDQQGNVWATHLLENSLSVLGKSGNVSVVSEPELLLPPISVPFYGETGIIGYTVGQPVGDPAAAGNAIWYTHFLTNELVRLDLGGIVVP